MVPTLPWKPNQMTSVATSPHVVRPSPGHGSHSQTTGAHAPRVAKPATPSLVSSGSAHLRGDGSGCWIRLGVPAAGPGPGRLHRGLDPFYTMGVGWGWGCSARGIHPDHHTPALPSECDTKRCKVERPSCLLGFEVKSEHVPGKCCPVHSCGK